MCYGVVLRRWSHAWFGGVCVLSVSGAIVCLEILSMRVSHCYYCMCVGVMEGHCNAFSGGGYLSICHLVWGFLCEGDQLGYFCEGFGVDGSCSADDYRDYVNVSFPLPVVPDGLLEWVVDAFYLRCGFMHVRVCSKFALCDLEDAAACVGEVRGQLSGR